MFLPIQTKMGSSSWLPNWQVTAKRLMIEAFYILTINLLNLLLPLSFLLLARLACAQYLETVIAYPSEPSNSYLFSVFLYTNPALLYILVSTVSVATLVHGLTGKLTVVSESPGKTCHPRLYTAWILLCTLQVCVGLGIEGSIEAGMDGASFGVERSLVSRVVFFLGLHETMLLWFRMVVKPVVDDTCFGENGGVRRQERWVERVAIGVCFGGIWWWKLRDEVESLVVVPEAKKEMLMSLGVADFVGWWLYYLTVTIGMVRVVKGLLWLGVVLLCIRQRRSRNNAAAISEDDDGDDGGDGKV